MGKFNLVTIVTFFLCFNAFATNGDNLIGLGAVSRAMGGTGYALELGPESAIKNPAMMSTEKDIEIAFAATYFMPDVEVKGSYSNKTSKSAADSFAIPSIGLTYKINEKMNFGLGMFGASGLGVDYRDSKEAEIFRMSTALSIFKFNPAISYQHGNMRFGMGLPLMYGTLAISYYSEPDSASGDTVSSYVSPGVSDDMGMGFNFGFAYDYNDFTFALDYQSKIAMEYKLQVTEAGTDFGISDVMNHNKIEQPAEMGAGIAYDNEKFIVSLDYKLVKWSSTKGYGDFGWEDQNIIGLGLGYRMGANTFRLGYSMGDHPLGDKAIKNTSAGYGTTNNRDAIDMFNLIGFPATTETHITAGLTRVFSDRFTFDFAFVYAPEVTEKMNAKVSPLGAVDYTIKHSQTSATLAGRWNF